MKAELKTSGIGRNDIKGFLSFIVSAYRGVPMLYELGNGRSSECKKDILEDLHSAYQQMGGEKDSAIFNREVLGFVNSNPGWISYNLADMRYFVDSLLGYERGDVLDNFRMNKYMCMMRQKHKYIGLDSFSISVQAEKVLDIGCGPFTMANSLMSFNHINEYIGIDKRNMQDYVPKSHKCSFEFVQEDATRINWSKYSHIDTVVMCEFLHCFNESFQLRFFEELIISIRELKNIVIIEPDINRFGMGFGFRYHMKKHADGYVPTQRDIAAFCAGNRKTFRVDYPSAQQIAYIIEV